MIDNIFLIFVMSQDKRSMHSDDGLKAQIEEAEKDLLFYLRKYHELTSRSKFMKAVVDKEIRLLEQKLKELGKYF